MKTKSYINILFLIFGSFGFAFNIGNTVHEFGHAIADRIAGIPGSHIHVIIHPFFSPHMYIEGGIPNRLMGFPDAAGPLANMVLGLIVFSLLWKFRNPYLLPFLFWGPLALVQEGIGLIVTTSQAGTDAFRIIAAGFPAFILLPLCVLLIAGGLLLFTLLIPVTGMPLNSSFFKRLGILAAGILPYGIITFVISLLFSQDQSDISRSFNIIAGFVILIILVSVIFRPLIRVIRKIHNEREYVINWHSSVFALGLLVVIIVLELILLN